MSLMLTLRNGLLIFLLAGLLLILLKPGLVIETNYSQGFLGGLPRLSGLAPYAVTQGFLALLSLMLLWQFPLASKASNRLGWILGLLALILAQSKTAWGAAIVCAVYLYGESQTQKLSNNSTHCLKSQHAIGFVAALMLTGGLVLALYLLGGFEARIDKLLNTKEGQQLSSLTGRDVIWNHALREWANAPFFGYGPFFLDFEQRLAIGMPNATHAHNQFIDTLARSGLIGLMTMLAYLWLLWRSISRIPSSIKGLATALFLALMFRAISEVPFTLYGYGIEILAQFALLTLIVQIQPRPNASSPFRLKAA